MWGRVRLGLASLRLVTGDRLYMKVNYTGWSRSPTITTSRELPPCVLAETSFYANVLSKLALLLGPFHTVHHSSYGKIKVVTSALIRP
ncbi:hypothetical protein EDB89DRAFT_1988489 [Lactarius sanguifluus]|nr:hypothetical protein EDB89DRAFT_1988489 [Lactarius sanguifluus]